MSNKIETPIYLVTADVYLRFPEIMEEEYKDLLEYLDDENILYERCTGDINELQNKVQQLKWDIESVTNYYNDAKDLYFKTRDKVQQLETNIAEAIKLLLDNTADYTDGDFESMRFQNDIVEIFKNTNQYTNIQVIKDINGIDRILKAVKQ